MPVRISMCGPFSNMFLDVLLRACSPSTACATLAETVFIPCPPEMLCVSCAVLGADVS